MDVANLSICVDSNGVPKADRELRKLEQQAGRAEGKTGKLGATSIKASDSLKTLGSSASSTTAAAGRMTAGITAGVTAIAAMTATMASAVSTGREYEQQQLRTEQLLKATGHAAGLTATQLEAHARALALNTLASTEGVRDAQAALLTFRSVSGDTFTRTIELAQDMAAVFGGDLKSATMQLGKALEDPATGLTALRRSGVSFTEEERKMITSMYDTGDAAKAQAFILGKLEAQVGGAGAAEGGGLSGSVDTLGQRWDELTNEIYKSANAGTTMGGVIDGLSNSLGRYTSVLETARILEEALNEERASETGSAQTKQAYELAIEEARQQYEHAQEQIRILEQSDPLFFRGAHEKHLQDYRDKAEQALQQIKNIEDKYIVQAEKDREAAEDKRLAAEKKFQDEIAEAKRTRAEERRLIDQRIEEEALRQQQARNDQWLLSLEQRLMSETDLINSHAEQERIRAETEIADKQQLAEALVLIEQNKNDQLEQLRQEQAEKVRRDLEQQRAMQEQALNHVTSFTERQLSLTTNMLIQAGEEQSGLYKALFAAQKAAAIPSMIVATEEAATKALAAVPPPYNMGLSAAVRGMGYAGVGIVAGQAIAGARASGGQTLMGELYRTGEHGGELFTGRSGQQIFIPPENGSITPTHKLNKSQGDDKPVTVNVYNAPEGTTVDYDTQTQTINIAVGEAVKQAKRSFIDDISRGGEQSRALERTYPLRRGGR